MKNEISQSRILVLLQILQHQCRYGDNDKILTENKLRKRQAFSTFPIQQEVKPLEKLICVLSENSTNTFTEQNSHSQSHGKQGIYVAGMMTRTRFQVKYFRD